MFNQSDPRNSRTLGIIAAIAGERRNIIMRGGWKNGSVIIAAKIEDIGSDRHSFISGCEKAFKEKSGDAFDFVTNSSDVALQGTYRKLSLSDPSILSGKTILFEALDSYFKLQEEGRLVLGADNFKIRPESIEASTSDRGQKTYRVNWATLKPETIGVLLISHASVIETPYNSRFLQQVYDISKAATPDSMTESERAFKAVTEGFDNLNG